MKHFIFDLDGTLIDTEISILKTWQKTLEDYGHHFSLDDLQVVLGVPTQIGLERLCISADNHFTSCWLENYKIFAHEAAFFPDAEKLLLKLKEQGCILGIISSRCKKEYQDYFDRFHLDRFFSVIVLEEDTAEHKPNPAPALKYLSITGANPKECLYIGDMPGDMDCANAAGIYSGFVKWNRSDRECKQATYVFHEPLEILSLL